MDNLFLSLVTGSIRLRAHSCPCGLGSSNGEPILVLVEWVLQMDSPFLSLWPGFRWIVHSCLWGLGSSDGDHIPVLVDWVHQMENPFFTCGQLFTRKRVHYCPRGQGSTDGQSVLVHVDRVHQKTGFIRLTVHFCPCGQGSCDDRVHRMERPFLSLWTGFTR